MDAVYTSGLKELLDAIDRGATAGIWKAAETVCLIGEMKDKAEGDFSKMRALVARELSWSRWWASTLEKDRFNVIGAAEAMAASLDGGDEIGGDVVGLLGQERIDGGDIFVKWFEDVVPSFNVENGHLLLAKALGPRCVYHATKSGDKGVHELVWEKVARRWEWMSSHPGGFVVAGRELVALGRERVGRVLMQNAHLGEKAVALKLALHGGTEMEGEVRDVIGIEPFGGGGSHINDALELRIKGDLGRLMTVAGLGIGKLAAGGQARRVKVWEIESGKCLHIMEKHGWWVRALVMVGQNLVCGAESGTVRVMDVETGECIQELLHEGDVYGLTALSEDSFAVLVRDQELVVWGRQADQIWSQVKKLTGSAPTPAGPASTNPTPAYSPVSPSYDQTDPSMYGATSPPTMSIQALPGGLIASSRQDGRIFVESSQTGLRVGALLGHTDVTDMAVLGDGRLVSCAEDASVRVWPLTYDGCAEVVLQKSPMSSHFVCLATMNDVVVGGDTSGWITMWKVKGGTLQEIGTLLAHRGDRVEALAFLDHDRFASVGHDGEIAVWRLSRYRPKKAGHRTDLLCGHIDANGRILSGGGSGGCIVIWAKPERGREATVISANRPQPDTSYIQRLATVEGGVAYWCVLATAVYLLADDGSEALELPSRVTGVWGLKSALNGSLLFALDEAGLTAWDVSTRSLKFHLPVGAIAMDVLANGRVILGGRTGSVWTVEDLSHPKLKESGIVDSGVLILSIAYIGGNSAVAVNTSRELWLIDLATGDSKKLCDGAEQVYAHLGEGAVLLMMSSLVIYDTKKSEVVAEIGGLWHDNIRNIAWEPALRLAVVFLEIEMTWIAYEL